MGATCVSNLEWRFNGNTEDVDATQADISSIIVETNEEVYHLLSIAVETLFSQDVVTPAVISIGSNAPDYNNIIASMPIQILKPFAFYPVINGVSRIQQFQEIRVKVITPSVATVHKFRCAIVAHIGYPGPGLN